MKTSVVSGDIAAQKVGAIVVNLFEGVTAPAGPPELWTGPWMALSPG